MVRRKEEINIENFENVEAEIVKKEMRYFFSEILGWDKKHFYFGFSEEIDLETTYRDYLQAKEVSVFVQTRNLSSYLPLNLFEEHVNQLKRKIIESSYSAHRANSDRPLTPIDFGILFFRFRFQDYNENNLKNLLDQYLLSDNKQNNPPLIFILDNYLISRWYYFFDKINVKERKKVSIYYPSHGNNYFPTYDSSVSIFNVFSDVVLGKIQEDDEERKFAFVLCEPKTRVFEFLASCCSETKFGFPDEIYFGCYNKDSEPYLEQMMRKCPAFEKHLAENLCELIPINQDYKLAFEIGERRKENSV